ncbi:BAG family molecular chaperone regulator 7-like [Nymphaea colorata]|nr:BAG family molecular chaperone regulator 7-like [Nymphaea colorata]
MVMMVVMITVVVVTMEVFEWEDGNDSTLVFALMFNVRRRCLRRGEQQPWQRLKAEQGKSRKQLSPPEDAALIIQMSFRAHLVRPTQMLRGHRDLAIADAKLKELRSLFDYFFYAEERQRFSEKIILPLTVEDISLIEPPSLILLCQGPDLMIREADRSMIKELEAMLETVDPQPAGKLAWFKRRKFDLPETCSNGELVEMAKGAAEVVQMLDQDSHKVDIHG